MTTGLRLLDDDGHLLFLGTGRAVEVGMVAPGRASAPRRAWVKNTGSEALHFVRVRPVLHPTEQRGEAAATVAATELGPSAEGAYAREIELGTIAPGASRSFWVRWTVPAGTPAGRAVWAIEALGSPS